MLTQKLIPNPTPQQPRKKKKQPPTTIVLNGRNITLTDQHKFLGVIVDTELRFKKHTDYVLGKGTKMVNQVRRLSKMARGMQGEYARQMYYAAAAATMHYANDIWCPTVLDKHGKRQQGMTGAIKKMDLVQRKAAIQATGALRTTPTDLLFAHADMNPSRLQLMKSTQMAALQLATLPKTHPLH